jgi:hypothetical protein
VLSTSHSLQKKTLIGGSTSTVFFMKFLHGKPLNREERALEEYVMNNLDQIHEEEISDSKLAQEVFLLKHLEELSEKAEERLVPKILEDIDWILNEGCAREISTMDFNHVHLCSFSPFPLFDVNALLSDDNVELLYHTCEEWFVMPYYAKRNVKSSLGAPPEIIPLEYKESANSIGLKTYQFSKTAVSSQDLGWSEYGKIEFEGKTDGPYMLKSGKKLSMTGILWNLSALVIKLKGAPKS